MSLTNNGHDTRYMVNWVSMLGKLILWFKLLDSNTLGLGVGLHLEKCCWTLLHRECELFAVSMKNFEVTVASMDLRNIYVDWSWV